jgi:hypothetical protein
MWAETDLTEQALNDIVDARARGDRRISRRSGAHARAARMIATTFQYRDHRRRFPRTQGRYGVRRFALCPDFTSNMPGCVLVRIFSR